MTKRLIAYICVIALLCGCGNYGSPATETGTITLSASGNSGDADSPTGNGEGTTKNQDTTEPSDGDPEGDAGDETVFVSVPIDSSAQMEMISGTIASLEDIPPGTGGFRAECMGIYSLLMALEFYPEIEPTSALARTVSARVQRLIETDMTDSDLPASDIFLACASLAKYACLMEDETAQQAISTAVSIYDIADTYSPEASDASSPETPEPETTPQETLASETTPQETTPQETTPQETTPQETTPQETTPQETTPQETTPQETTALKENLSPPEKSLAAIELYRYGNVDERLSYVTEYLEDADFTSGLSIIDFLTITAYLNTPGDMDMELSGSLMSLLLKETEDFAIRSKSGSLPIPEYAGESFTRELVQDMLKLSVANYVIKNHEYNTILVNQQYYLNGSYDETTDCTEELNQSVDLPAMLIFAMLSSLE